MRRISDALLIGGDVLENVYRSTAIEMEQGGTNQ